MKQQYGTPRRTGQSTRLVDQYVQQLFTFGEIEVRDHFDSVSLHELLTERVLLRLKNEHHLLMPFIFREGTKITFVQGGDLNVSPIDYVHEIPNLKNETPVTTT